MEGDEIILLKTCGVVGGPRTADQSRWRFSLAESAMGGALYLLSDAE
jgi:hypothetical protein